MNPLKTVLAIAYSVAPFKEQSRANRGFTFQFPIALLASAHVGHACITIIYLVCEYSTGHY